MYRLFHDERRLVVGIVFPFAASDFTTREAMATETTTSSFRIARSAMRDAMTGADAGALYRGRRTAGQWQRDRHLPKNHPACSLFQRHGVTSPTGIVMVGIETDCYRQSDCLPSEGCLASEQ